MVAILLGAALFPLGGARLDQVEAVGPPVRDPNPCTPVEEDAAVIDVVSGVDYGEAGPVVRIDAATVQPGSSGGAALNRDGQVAAVVFAIHRASDHVLALPASTARRRFGQPLTAVCRPSGQAIRPPPVPTVGVRPGREAVGDGVMASS